MKKILNKLSDIHINLLHVWIIFWIILWFFPNLQLLWYDRTIESILKICLAFVFFVAWHGAYRNVSRSITYSLPFVLIWPFDVYFTAVYSTPPSTHVLNIIDATSYSEALDYVTGRVGYVFWLIMLAIAIWYCGSRATRKITIDVIPNSLRIAFRIIIALVFFSAIGSFAFVPKLKNNEILIPPMMFRIDKLNGVFPFGRIIILSEFFRDNRNALLVQEILKERPLGAVRQILNKQPYEKSEIFMLIIGETGRADHWQLNGYQRHTNKYLSKVGVNLVNLPNVVSPWSNTLSSIPVIMSRKPSTSRAQVFGERSVLSAFNEIGFETYWLSNQNSSGGLAYLSIEANHRNFINANTHQNPIHGFAYDEKMLEPLHTILTKDSKSKFIVIHLLGSHDAYHKRYPQNFNVFQPSLTDKPDADHHSVENKGLVVNAYDNSVLYTDYVLNLIISEVRNNKFPSVVIYSADHGESLFDGECNFSGHGSSNASNYPVSSFIWISDEYFSNHQEKFKHVLRNSNKPLTTEFIFHTLTDMADITNINDLTKSLASSSFRLHQRIVNTPSSIDWDTAVRKGKCDSLISK